MIYKCENCKNRHNCAENKEQYEKTCEIINTIARGIDRLPDCHSWYGITVKCDYWEEDKEMGGCKSCSDHIAGVGKKEPICGHPQEGVKIPVISMEDVPKLAKEMEK